MNVSDFDSSVSDDDDYDVDNDSNYIDDYDHDADSVTSLDFGLDATVLAAALAANQSTQLRAHPYARAHSASGSGAGSANARAHAAAERPRDSALSSSSLSSEPSVSASLAGGFYRRVLRNGVTVTRDPTTGLQTLALRTAPAASGALFRSGAVSMLFADPSAADWAQVMAHPAVKAYCNSWSAAARGALASMSLLPDSLAPAAALQRQQQQQQQKQTAETAFGSGFASMTGSLSEEDADANAGAGATYAADAAVLAELSELFPEAMVLRTSHAELLQAEPALERAVTTAGVAASEAAATPALLAVSPGAVRGEAASAAFDGVANTNTSAGFKKLDHGDMTFYWLNPKLSIKANEWIDFQILSGAYSSSKECVVSVVYEGITRYSDDVMSNSTVKITTQSGRSHTVSLRVARGGNSAEQVFALRVVCSSFPSSDYWWSSKFSITDFELVVPSSSQQLVYGSPYTLQIAQYATLPASCTPSLSAVIPSFLGDTITEYVTVVSFSPNIMTLVGLTFKAAADVHFRLKCGSFVWTSASRSYVLPTVGMDDVELSKNLFVNGSTVSKVFTVTMSRNVQNVRLIFLLKEDIAGPDSDVDGREGTFSFVAGVQQRFTVYFNIGTYSFSYDDEFYVEMRTLCQGTDSSACGFVQSAPTRFYLSHFKLISPTTKQILPADEPFTAVFQSGYSSATTNKVTLYDDKAVGDEIFYTLTQNVPSFSTFSFNIPAVKGSKYPMYFYFEYGNGATSQSHQFSLPLSTDFTLISALTAPAGSKHTFIIKARSTRIGQPITVSCHTDVKLWFDAELSVVDTKPTIVPSSGIVQFNCSFPPPVGAHYAKISYDCGSIACSHWSSTRVTTYSVLELLEPTAVIKYNKPIPLRFKSTSLNINTGITINLVERDFK